MKLRWLVLSLVLSCSVSAQESNVFTAAWASVFNSSGFDGARHAIVDAQGNFIIVGQTFDPETSADGLVIKMNAAGKRLWARKYDSPLSGDDFFSQCATDLNGNVAVVGIGADRDAQNAFIVASYGTALGAQRWLRRFPGKHASLGSVGLDQQGNILASVAVENGSAQIIRTYKFRSFDGVGLWTNEVHAARDLRFGLNSQLPMLVAADGGCYLAGVTNNATRGDLDWLIIRLQPDGRAAGSFDVGNPRYEAQPFMTFHSSGDLLVAGNSENLAGGFDVVIQRLRADNGGLVWQTKLSGTSVFKSGSHLPVEIRSDSAGRVFMVGNSPGWGGFVSRFSSVGDLEWTTHFLQTSLGVVPLNNGQSVLTLDGGVAWIDNDGCVLKFDPTRQVAIAAADGAGNVYVESSFLTENSTGDFGLKGEKLIISRAAAAPKFTKLVDISGGLPFQSYELAPEVSGANLKYFWNHNGVPIPGATNRTLTIPTVNAATIGYYSLEVTNEFGATLCPDIEVLTLVPIFVQQPKNQTFVYDGDLAFSALAVGFEPQQANAGVLTSYLTYQWQYADDLNFTWYDLNGETESKLLIRNADYDWAGYYDFFGTWRTYYYRCVVTIVYPQIPGGVAQNFSSAAKVDFPWEYVEEVSANRNRFVLTGEALSQPSGMNVRAAGGVHVSMQSGNTLFRVDLNNGDIVGFTQETFKPAVKSLPRSPHLFDSQGDYYSIGETNRHDTWTDWFVAKHSAAGAVLWSQNIGALGHNPDEVADAVLDLQENLIISGYAITPVTGRDFLTVCLRKEDGNIKWTGVYHDPESLRVRFTGDTPSQNGVDPQGNVYVAGMTYTTTKGYYLLVSYNTNGTQRFVYRREFSFGNDPEPLLAVDSDGSSILAGGFGLVKIDRTGRELWSTDPRPSSQTFPNKFLGMQLDKMGNIYVSESTSDGYYIEKFDAFGNSQFWTDAVQAFPEWNFQPGGRFYLDDFGNAYVPGSGGNVTSEKDIFLLKLNAYMEQLWAARVDGDAEGFDYGFDLRVRGTNVFLTGTVSAENTTAVSLTQFHESPNPVRITHLSRSRTIRKGTTLIAGTTVTGIPNKFRWYHDGALVSGQTTSTLTIPNIDYAHEGFYYLVAENGAGYIGTSGGIAIRVAEAPLFVTQPQSTNVPVKGDIRLSAQVSGTEPMTLQWMVDGKEIPGATNNALFIAAVEYQNKGNYRLYASNEWGSAMSSAATVFISRPPNLPPRTELSEPVAGVVRKDLSPVLIRAKVYDPDGRVVRVAFKANGAQVGNVTTAPFEMMWTPPAPGIYRVTAEGLDNLSAIGKSAEVQLIIAPEPTIVKEPGPTVTIPENGDIELTADATGAPPPRYQWRLNGANIPDATNRTYTVGGAQVKHSGKYAVLVVNEGAAKISSQTEVIVETEALAMKDKLSEAVARSDIQFTGRASNLGATKEIGEPNHARRRGGSSMWLKWKAPASGVLSLNTRGSAIDTLLGVYIGADIPSLTKVSADDERGGFHCSATRFNAIKDQTYLFVVDGFKGQTGNIVLSWALDATARDLPLLLEEPIGISSTLGATRQFQASVTGSSLKFQWYLNGYPIPGATSLNLGLSSLSKTNLGNYVLRISNDGGSVETISAELEAASIDTLVTQDRAEDLRLGAAIGDKAYSTGYPTISPGIPYQHLFNTQGSTTDNDEPILGDGGGASKWFMVTAGGAGTLVADTSGSQNTTLLTLHDGSNFDTLPVLANGVAQPDGSSRVQHAASAGKSYVMRVDGPEGTVTLNVNIGTAPIMSSTPLDRVMSAGENITLTATVNASPAATFQWLLNGIVLSGKTAGSLEITNFDEAQVGMYELEARNPLATVRKTVAYLELRRDTIFSPLAKVAGGGTQIQLQGNNLTYWIDATTDFKSWTNVFSGRAENGALIFTEQPIPSDPYRFYRARIQ